jgi:cobalt/nickel transport system ATP-binding protein
MTDILQVENVTYSYFGSILALDDVSLSVERGERLAIIGSNGSGKSSLLHIMNGLIFPLSGSVYLEGQQVNERRLKESNFLRFFRQRIGYLFQDPDVQLFCPTVFDELLFGPLQLGLTDKESAERASEMMAMLQLENLKDRPSYMLSGGEKKRVALGAMLTMNPDILLLDEPGNGLDPRSYSFLVELVIALSEAGKTIVVATHDLSLIGELGCRVVVLSEQHRVEKTGSAEEIIGDEELLLRVNLIHEHVHFHGSAIHRHAHSHYLFHRHNHQENGAK